MLKSFAQVELLADKGKEWMFSLKAWGEEFLSTEDQPFEMSHQQAELASAYCRLVRAKFKKAIRAPMDKFETALANKIGVSVQSGHGTGKDYMASVIGLHALMCLPDPKVMCTAPAGPQLKSVLWSEFARTIKRSPKLAKLITHQNNMIYMSETGGKENFIQPRTILPSSAPEEQAETLAGLHSYTLVRIIDEASGVPEAVFKPIEGGMTDPLSIVLLIFNPTRHHGYAIDTQTKYRQHWLCLHWDGEALRDEVLASPKKLFWFDPDAQLRIKEKFGAESDFYNVRVRGYPPRHGADKLIPYEWAMQAVSREMAYLDSDPLVLGVDVSGEGTDRTVIVGRRGPVILEPLIEVRHPSLERIADAVEEAVYEWSDEDSKDDFTIGVDRMGIGHGVYDYMKNIRKIPRVYPIDVNKEPRNGKLFHRLRDEIWWQTRESFEKGLIKIPNHDDLIGQLTIMDWEEPRGKIKVVSKMKIRNRGLPSPDHADALVITEHVLRRYAPSALTRREKGGTLRYGRRSTRRRGGLSWKTQ